MSPVSELSLEANGIRHHVLTSGDPGARAVHFIHGLGWDSGLWQSQLDTLAARGWYAIAPDLRGMGRTAKPNEPYSIDLYAADMAAILDALDVNCAAVVGFSLGGMIAMRLAQRRPDLVGGALFACCGASYSVEGQKSTEAMLARAIEQGPRRFAEEQAESVWHPVWAAANPQAVSAFIDWRASMDQPALHRAFRSSYGADLWPALKGMDIPARVIAAENDSFVSLETALAIAEALPNADLEIIREAGHMCSIEKPEAFDSALFGFLDKAWPAHASQWRTPA